MFSRSNCGIVVCEVLKIIKSVREHWCYYCYYYHNYHYYNIMIIIIIIIIQDDTLWPLLFCIALIPLTYVLNRADCGYQVHGAERKISVLTVYG
jgi:hypothetical protein